MKGRVLVAMSGGVDSAVAAGLLRQKGYEVVGVTMCFNLPLGGDIRRPSCCDISSIEDARRIAAVLGIRHYVLSFGHLLRQRVIDNFCREYLSGRTPNPCVRCNRFLKFGALLDKARQLSCDYLATGHYARVVCSRGHYLLKKGRDNRKDQSYFLYAISSDTLPYLLFPLGKYSKDEVRRLAREMKLPVCDKPGSQEICFVSGGGYRQFILRTMGRGAAKTGPILRIDGRVLGEHNGIAFYTVGQRRALGGGRKRPLYVIRIDAKKNAIILGEERELYSSRLSARQVNLLIVPKPKKAINVKAKIRYNQQEVPARLSFTGPERIALEFAHPQRAISPGQSVVFYRGDIVLGGGVII
ncbi:MAG: tRNA 2-thiouridine(34) synthase MnmA [Candidatus Omnitrophota bacterium]